MLTYILSVVVGVWCHGVNVDILCFQLTSCRFFILEFVAFLSYYLFILVFFAFYQRISNSFNLVQILCAEFCLILMHNWELDWMNFFSQNRVISTNEVL